MGRSTGHFSELASMEASSPVLLLRVLDLPSISNPQQLTSLYFTDAETFIDFFDENGNPEAYIPVGLSFDKVTVDNSGSMVSFRVKLDNVSRDFCTLAGSVRVQGAQLQLLRAFREDLSNPDAGQTLISGIIQAWTITEKSIEAEVTSPVALSMRTPQRLYWPKCGWKFGGDGCGYWSAPSTTNLATQANAISGGDLTNYPKTQAFDGATTLYAPYPGWKSSQTGTNVALNA